MQPVRITDAGGPTLLSFSYNEFVDVVDIPLHAKLVYRVRLDALVRLDFATPTRWRGRALGDAPPHLSSTRRVGPPGRRWERPLHTDRHELGDHPERGVEEDVAVHRPAPDGASCRRVEIERPVVQTHPVDQGGMGRDVHHVDELVVGQLEERLRDRVVVDEANGLDREPVRVPGVMGGRIVLDRQLLERRPRRSGFEPMCEHVLERTGGVAPSSKVKPSTPSIAGLPDGGEGDRSEHWSRPREVLA